MIRRPYRCDRCYWCGCETFSKRKVGKWHPKLATVDHVRSKPECINADEYHDPFNKVNACYACNQRRSREWVIKMQTGQIIPTEWSIRFAEARRRHRAYKKERKTREVAERELVERCPPCRVLNIKVAPELESAYAEIGL